MTMVTEAARVAAVDEDGFAWVETRRKAVCDSCSVQKGCGTSVLARLFGRRMARVRVRNTLDARVGDEVIVGIEDGLLVRSSVAAYLMPLIWMLLGAIGGGMIAEALQWPAVEGVSAVGGLLGLAAGFASLRRYARISAAAGTGHPVLVAYAGDDGAGNGGAGGEAAYIEPESIGRSPASGHKGAIAQGQQELRSK